MTLWGFRWLAARRRGQGLLLASVGQLHNRLSHLATSAELRAVLDRPALATLTILCERPQRKAEQAPPHSEYDWVPSCLGGELFLSPGESSRLILQPQFPIRNLRWFVSGDPAIVLEGLVIGNQHTSACRGGTKYGDWQGTVAPGCNITAELRRCAP